ncbi:MAG TPA: methionyl-tRNA formyltransferase [Candidatus Acidoferrum sp.]|nr:methionyl-tRNA formyltransferase [Candidatus Acidoferrum sp.]
MWERSTKRLRLSPWRRAKAFLKIVFAGTAEFAVPSLNALVDAGQDVQLVVTQPDRPARRGMKLTPPPVKVAALALGLEVYQPERIREPEAVERIRRLQPDLLVVVAYGQIIPRSVLGIPKLGALNVHASLLPRHRGAAPVAAAILAGDSATGVTIMRMDEQLDHGPILAMRSVDIGAREDAVALTSRLAAVGSELLVETLANLDASAGVEQDHGAATVARRLSRADGELEWEMGALEIDRRVRALQPWPGATLPTKKGRVKVLSGHVEGDLYVPDVVQLPGKRPAPAKQVLRDA